MAQQSRKQGLRQTFNKSTVRLETLASADTSKFTVTVYRYCYIHVHSSVSVYDNVSVSVMVRITAVAKL